jgi:hypothetical protein
MKRTAARLLLVAWGMVLAGCGGDAGGEHVVTGQNFSLAIDGPPTVSNADAGHAQQLDGEGRWALEGSGFLPDGTTCARRSCTPDAFGMYESAHLGPHELSWRNETTGASGNIGNLSWFCYCERPPRWAQYAPVVLGQNRIVITQRAGAVVRQVSVLVTRQ